MKAMILAAGRGERMRPLTDTTPKPLLDAGGKPLIVWHIERLVTAGIRDIIINHAWLGEQIEQTLGQGHQFGARLRYSAETSALETAGGIAQALPFFRNKPFLVINGDIWCDWDPMQAAAYAQTVNNKPGTLAWLLLVDNPEHNASGDFQLRPDHARNAVTSPGDLSVQATGDAPCIVSPVSLAGDNKSGRTGTALTFSGIGIYQPDFFADIQTGQAAALGPMLRTAATKNQVIGTHHRGEWIDVGTPARLDQLRRHLALKGQARYTSA